MLPTSLDKLEDKLKIRYGWWGKKNIGIMLARYTKSNVKKLIAESYKYCHENTKNDFDIAWVGYRYNEYARSGRKWEKVIEINNDNIYFDMKDYVDSKNILKDIYKLIKRDNLELILVNYYDGKLHFNENIRIDLSKNEDHIDRIILNNDLYILVVSFI